MLTRLIPLILFSSIVGCSPAWATAFRTQEPCVGSSSSPLGDIPPGFCVQFDHDDPIPVVRSLTFSLPAPGRVLAQFNGTVLCENTVAADLIVHLTSQIVLGAGAGVNARGPGGMVMRDALKSEGDQVFSLPSQVEFNLASTRTVTYASAGTKTVFFRINRNFMHSGVFCFVYNPSFIVTIP